MGWRIACVVGQLREAEVSALLSSGDIFALASYYEGYGMAFAEAMAHGLPIVASGDGAVADTVPPQAGFVCAPGDANAIARALRSLLLDESLRHAKAEAAWQHGQTLPQWTETAAIIATALESVRR
ncbi:MAG: glycosyltransferase family 4 protein [Rhodomicrobium sp.]